MTHGIKKLPARPVPGTGRIVDFTVEDWPEGVLEIPRFVHRCDSEDALAYELRHLVDGKLVSTTWAVFETVVRYRPDRTVVLIRKKPYPGRIEFWG